MHVALMKDILCNFLLLLLQSQLDIPFKVRAGHIGEIVVAGPICHLSLDSEEDFLTSCVFCSQDGWS